MAQEEFFKRYTYNIRTDRIGGGGFGTVYKAHDRILHREVAIKVSEVKTAANGKVFSLKDEFEALQHLPKHPNIANYEELHSFAMPNGFFDYAVMQYYPDGNLTNLIGTSLSIKQKEDIALQLLEGLAFLHEHKVVHRDLKPGNILIARYGEEICPIITDFGLSKTADAGDRSMFSNSFGGGTARYSSPEQLQGRPLRMNTDLWSYGAVVYELFAGRPLFKAGSSADNSAQADLEIYNKIIHGDTEGRLSDIPDKWRKVLERCMVVNPEKRAKSAEELKKMLNKYVAATDKTTLSNEKEHEVEEDPTFIEFPDPPKEKPATLKASESVLSVPKSQSKPKKVLPWIIGGGVAAVVLLAAVLGITLGNTKKHAEFEGVEEIVEEEVALIADPATEALAQTYTVNGVSFTMKYVEGGTFQMGATPEQGESYYNEEPAHFVTVSDFCIGESEVTQALWTAVMGYNPSSFRGDNLPIEHVSWYDCQEFIKKINALTKKTFRLPTEAEWEYAARGGNKSRGYKYSGSDNIDDVCTASHWGWETPHPVKEKMANELGLFDMTGNVDEWCEDRYGRYTDSPQINPHGASNNKDRVVRNGWRRNISGRMNFTPSYNGYNNSGRGDTPIGFRLVLVP